MNKIDQTYSLKLKAARSRRFKSRCYICHTKISKKKRFTFHHLWYISGDVVHSNYPKNSEGRLCYMQDLVREIKRDPKRFLLLCGAHHQALERIHRYGSKNLNRLLKANRMTKT